MKIVIAASGTRGDVQPYIALGLELVNRGHEVVLATEERMKPLVELLGPGITFAQVTGDPQGIILEKKNQKLLAEGKTSTVLHARTDANNQAFGPPVLNDYWAACQGADLIISAWDCLCLTATMSCAEKLGVPWVPVALRPVMPTGEFPPSPMSSKPGQHPIPVMCFNPYMFIPLPIMWVHPFDYKWVRKSLYRFFYWARWKQDASRINAWRKEVLGLPPMTKGLVGVLDKSAGMIPVVQMCSRFFIPGLHPPGDWPSHAHVTGSAYLPDTPEEEVDEKLRQFVLGGKKPLYLGFGSMPAPDPKALVELAIEVVTQTGKRAVLCADWPELSAIIGPGEGKLQLPEKLLMIVPSAPHDWLLPRCCAAVHHCGVGIAVAVLRAGIPSIACPVMLDQPWYAERLVEAEVAADPIPFHEATAKVLVKRIASVCNNSIMQQRAQEVAATISKEYTGVNAAADIALGAKEPWTKMGLGKQKCNSSNASDDVKAPLLRPCSHHN